MSKTDAKAEKADKGKKGKDGKKKDKKSPDSMSLANHPRARDQIRRAKGWGGIAGFLIAGYLSFKAGVPILQLGIRTLAAGVAGYMLAGACAVTIWRQLLQAELRALSQQLERKRLEREAADDDRPRPIGAPSR
jgi:hypothetical protein